MLDKKFTVHVARESGHEQELMTREDIVEMVSANENTWVFVDSQMVSVAELENIELNDSTEIRINLAWSAEQRPSPFLLQAKRATKPCS